MPRVLRECVCPVFHARTCVTLTDSLQAPVPFLIGIDEEVLGMAEQGGLVPDDVVQVDLSHY